MESIELTTSPFHVDSENPNVYVAKSDDPYEDTKSLLSRIDLSPVKGKRVLLKPNAGRIASQGEGITTDPRVVAAAADVFVGAGAAEVAIGESPITGVKTLEAFEATGIASVVKDRNLPLIDMDARPCIKAALPDGKAIDFIKVCAEVFEYDIIVSIPVMKIHMHTGVTLAVKNMKGCLWRRSKVDLHMLPPVQGSKDKSLDIAIADMSKALRPHLSIIDGTICMEGLGPSAGKPKDLGVVIVSADAFAADAVACRLMCRRAEDIPHLKIGAERGYGIIDLDRINVEPDNWMDFAKEFETSPENLSIEFPGINILDSNSCSACQSTLLLFLKKYGDEILDYFPEGAPVNIAIGKGHEKVPEGTLCIGNCTASHKYSGTFVKGCPPVGSAIYRAISEKKDDDKD